MRRFVVVLAVAGFGCDGGKAPTSSVSPSVARPADPAASVTRAAPATVVYTLADGGARAVIATAEDGAGAPVTLSRAGVDTTYVAALAGRRAVIAERRGDGGLGALAIVALDGGGRRAHALPPDYQAVGEVKVAGDVAVVELIRSDGAARADLWAVREGGLTRLAGDARVAAVAGGRVAYYAGGALRSVALDGGASLGLGAGVDRLAAVEGDRLLLTVRKAIRARADVRMVGIDGSAPRDLTGAVAFGFAPGRVVYTRGDAILSAARDGGDERTLATGAALRLDGGRLFFSDGDALAVVDAAGGAPRTLDAHAPNAQVARVVGDRVVYTADSELAMALRSARLDGGGVAVLCDQPTWMPFVTGVTADGEVLFQRALAGQPEGGRAYAVRVDGRELRALGTNLLDGSGAVADDQDFEAVTPSGHVILEAEYEGIRGAQLLVADGEFAHHLTPAAAVRFAAVIP